MKLTIFILSLPVAIYFLGLLVTQSTHTFHAALFWAWFLTSIVCIERGRYILGRSRFLGWLCIGIGIIPFIVLAWRLIFHGGVKMHS